MVRGNIAVIISGWEAEFQERLIRGIWQRAKETEYNVSVLTCQGQSNVTKGYDIGEYNIYELLGQSHFDGVIVASNTIMALNRKEDIIALLRRRGTPTVSLEEPFDGISSVGIDNYLAMEKLMIHLVREHHYRELCFVAGPKDNYESNRRLQAYLDVLKETGSQPSVWYGDYTFESGRRMGSAIYTMREGLPEAIVCANDGMALGVCHELKSKGIRIPQDVKVTGYDNIYDAAHYSVGITTVGRPKEELGYAACSMLLEEIEGAPIQRVYMDSNVNIRESCGCKRCEEVDLKAYLEKSYWIRQQNIQNSTSFMERNDEIMECRNFQELLSYVERNIRATVEEEIFLCLNKSTYLRIMGEQQGENDFRIKGYEKEICIPYLSGEKQEVDCEEFGVEEVFPQIWKDAAECDIYLYIPLHFSSKCFGYVVLRGSIQPLTIPFYNTWIKSISNAIEEMLNIQTLSQMLKKMDELSMKDSLTGVFNRFGLARYIPEMVSRSKESHNPMYYQFVDIDNLKTINDKYGHEAGDQAISIVAQTLREIYGKQEIIIRYGGDEFLLVSVGGTAEELERKNHLVEQRLLDSMRNLSLPFCLSASIGYYQESPDEYHSIEYCIEQADTMMYEMKCESKKRKKKLDKDITFGG